MLTAALLWIAGAVLVLSGALKLGRHRQLQQSMREFGLPDRLLRLRWLAPAVPLGEIALGLGSIAAPPPLWQIAAWGCVALYTVFLLLVVRVAGRAEPVDCGCFGGLGSDRVSGRTVVRNAVLLLIAALGTVGGVPAAAIVHSASGWWSAVIVGGAATIIAASAVAYRGLRGRRHRRRLLDRLTLSTADGQQLPYRELLDPPTYLVFFSPSCSHCRELVERFRWWPHGLPEGHDLQPVFLGEPAAFLRHEAFAPLVEHAWYDRSGEVARSLGRQGTPGAVRVSRAHPFGEGWVGGGAEAERYVLRPGFIEQVTAAAPQPPASDPGAA